jgi:hypothetical protein
MSSKANRSMKLCGIGWHEHFSVAAAFIVGYVGQRRVLTYLLYQGCLKPERKNYLVGFVSRAV